MDYPHDQHSQSRTDEKQLVPMPKAWEPIVAAIVFVAAFLALIYLIINPNY